jgi:hypothetical protein
VDSFLAAAKFLAILFSCLLALCCDDEAGSGESWRLANDKESLIRLLPWMWIHQDDEDWIAEHRPSSEEPKDLAYLFLLQEPFKRLLKVVLLLSSLWMQNS